MKMVQIILVRVKKQVYSYLFENLALSAQQANHVLHLAGDTLKDLINEEMESGTVEDILVDLIGEGFLDLFRTPFALKFRQRLTHSFAQQTWMDKSKIDLLVLIILPYILSELSKELKKNIEEEGNAHLLTVVGISS
jgi:hypothetical protein